MITRLFFQTAVRHWRQSAGQFGLMLALLSLGVAVFVSVRLANRAAIASFSRFTETLTGRSDWTVRSTAGSLPDATLSALRHALGSRPVNLVGVVEASVVVAPRDSTPTEPTPPERQRALTILGVDVFALANIAEAKGTSAPRETRSETSTGWFVSAAGKNPAWVSPKSGLHRGETLRVAFGDHTVELTIAGEIPEFSSGNAAPDDLVVMDLPDAQRLLGRVGQLDRIELVVEPGANAERARAETGTVAQEFAQGRWSVETPGASRTAAETMTAAFRLNLTVLSLIALLVALYLIFQTLDGAVVRRRAEIAILRSLGVTESWIRRLWLAEAAVLGLLAGGFGALIGWGAAQWSVRLIGRTIDTLYFANTARSASLGASETALALALGIGASLLAGWLPARFAAQTPPAQFLSRHAAPAKRGTGRLLAWGLGFAVLGVVAAQLPPLRPSPGFRFPLGGYAAAFLWIFSGGVLAAAALPLCARATQWFSERSAPLRVASSYLRLPTTRHRFAVAALVCAIGMAAGMAILIASFETSVRQWIGQSLQADLYVAARSPRGATEVNRISPETVARLSHDPRVAHTTTRVYRPVEIDGLPTQLAGVDFHEPSVTEPLRWVERPALPPDHFGENEALVSESFSERFGKHRGDSVRARTPDGEKTVVIAGVYTDYASERGILSVQREVMQRWFHDEAVTHLSLTLRDGVSSKLVRAEWERDYPGLVFFENVALRRQILEIFRQTFSVTYALEIIGVVVAISSLAISLASVLLDRRDQLTTLRALGFRRRELAWSACGEGVAIASCATAGGLLLSLALGWLLIFVINKQSFGWTLGFVAPAAPLATLGVATIAVSAIVSFLVGRWGSALAADREE